MNQCRPKGENNVLFYRIIAQLLVGITRSTTSCSPVSRKPYSYRSMGDKFYIIQRERLIII